VEKRGPTFLGFTLVALCLLVVNLILDFEILKKYSA